MTVEAHAKINLTLEILGKRPDGYHELKSVVAQIPLHDDVELLDAPPGEVSVEMSASGTALPCVPQESNLAVRAAKALLAASGAARGVHIKIVKRIPAGAGLGGGSADAAAVINALNELWSLGFSKERLCEIGAAIGSDIPALILGGAVMMEGRGEHVTPLTDRPLPPFDETFVLRIPEVHSETAKVYGEFRDSDRGLSPNDLQPAACRLYPEIAALLEEMKKDGLENVQMSGSGSAVFGWKRKNK